MKIQKLAIALAAATLFSGAAMAQPNVQTDTQRNVNQEKRIEHGVKSGPLTTREAGSLERGQAQVDRREAKAAANGNVNAREQARSQRSENRQSRRIAHKKHNAKTAG